jgi:hypothetical protein
MGEARMDIGRNKLTNVAFAFNSPNIIQKISRCVGFKPENNTSVVIGKVVAPFLFPIHIHELQSELDRRMESVCLAGFFVRLLNNLTYCIDCDCSSRVSDINISENSLDGGMSKVM